MGTRGDGSGQLVSWRRRYFVGLDSAVSGNAQAFGFSILITVTYGMVSVSNGTPARAELFGFALAAVAAFTMLNLVIAWLSHKIPTDSVSTRVRLVATATDFLAVGAGVGAAAGVTAAIIGWPAWVVAPAVASLVYVLIQAVELAVGWSSSDNDRDG